MYRPNIHETPEDYLSGRRYRHIATNRDAFWLHNYGTLMAQARDWTNKPNSAKIEQTVAEWRAYAMELCDEALGDIFDHTQRVSGLPLGERE